MGIGMEWGCKRDGEWSGDRGRGEVRRGGIGMAVGGRGEGLM